MRLLCGTRRDGFIRLETVTDMDKSIQITKENIVMKKVLAAALCAATVMSASGALAADINFVTAGTSSTFYPISATVCQLWNDSIEGMRATATPSGGGIDNLNQALDGEAQIGIANANLVYQAREGIDSFEGYANDNLRIFAGLY